MLFVLYLHLSYNFMRFVHATCAAETVLMLVIKTFLMDLTFDISNILTLHIVEN